MKVIRTHIEQLEKDKPRYECRKWRLWVITKEKRFSEVFHGRVSDAKKRLAAFEDETADKIPNQDTFRAYAASWLAWREKSKEYAPGTIENNRREITALCRSDLADMDMDAITPESCRNELLWIKTHPQRKDSELSNTTMNKLYITLNSIMLQAYYDERIPRNPMEHVKAPKPDTKEKEALTPDELMLLVNRLDELPIDGRVMALYFMALAGLRRGEACAVADSDIANGYVHVRRAIKERTGKIAEPKSEAGKRVIPMPSRLAAKVAEWQALKARLGYADSETLCCNTKGGVLLPQNLQRWWSGDSTHKGIRDDIGCSGMTLHQLRHSNLSMVARHMSPFDLQHYAGWSSIEPARVYIHDDLDAVSRAIESAWAIA